MRRVIAACGSLLCGGRWLTWIVVCALAGSLVSSAAAGQHPQTRGGWLVGLGLGAGSSKVSIPAASTDREGGAAASLRVGYAFSSRISLELDGTAWAKEQNGTWVAFSATGPTLNYYPGGQGLVLRAGVGSGSAEASRKVGSGTLTGSESGAGILGGVAYEFRVARRFALGPEIHAAWIDLDNYNASWVSFVLGFHWYFIKS